MDLVDLKIIKLLLRNSRLPYREIAENLELTVNAIHKRVKNLCQLGVIRKFTAFPNLSNLKGCQVLISGISKASAIIKMCKELGENESVFFIGIAGGKHLLIDGELKSNDDLREYTSYVTKKAEISKPFISIVNRPQVEETEKYTNTDKAILKALKENGRKSSIEIAEETNFSVKTVRKTLKRLQEKNMVDFSIFWAPDSEKDIIGNFEIYLNENQTLDNESFRLLNEYPNIVYYQTFKDAPNLIMLTTWFDTSRKLQKTYEILDAYGYQEVVLRIIYTGYFFDTWRMKLFD